MKEYLLRRVQLRVLDIALNDLRVLTSRFNEQYFHILSLASIQYQPSTTCESGSAQ